METRIAFRHIETKEEITVENLSWLPNLEEKVDIKDSTTCIIGKVVDISHEIYTRSGTHYITITVK